MHLLLLFNIITTRGSSQDNWTQRKQVKGTLIGKKEFKLSLVVDNMDLVGRKFQGRNIHTTKQRKKKTIIAKNNYSSL